MNASDVPLRVFCSFAPEDADLCYQLHNHLRPLEREGILTFWHQRLITAGTDWTTAIDEQLASASIILLLISPAFFASDYHYGVEMQLAMQRHEAGDVRVIPIIMRSVDWTLAPFAHLSPLPITGKPIAEQRYRDIAFATVVASLRRVIEELAPTSTNISHMDTASGVWNVPYRRNPHFTGRDELLDRLDQQLSPTGQDASATTRQVALTQPQAIKGLGGIGKTQIAIEYAYRSREQGCYTHTFWVNAASEEAILTSFVTLAELLPQFPGKKEIDQRKLVAAMKRWLEQCQQRWLLIFDNADDVLLLQDYLPQRGNGSVLLTTRADAVGSLTLSIEVETMGFVEGTHLLLRRAQRFEHASDEEINEAGNIVVALDHFPLALDQAGAYIEETKCRFGDYLSIFQNHRQALLARRGTQVTNYPNSVATTWSLSFRKVEQSNPAAAEFLRLCAFLAPDRIPEELIKDGAAHWSPLLQQTVTDPFAFNQIIAELLKFSLIKRLAEDNMLSIHRLVQVVQMDTMEVMMQHEWAERVVRAVNEVFPRDPKEDVTSWPQCLRYLEQAQACDTLIQQHTLMLSEAADLLNRTGIYFHEHALYTIAEPLLEQALSIWEQRLGPEHLQVASSLNGLASLYAKQNNYIGAKPLYQQALRIREQQLGPRHSQVALLLANMANLYHEHGKYAEAQPLYQQALSIWEQQLEPEYSKKAYLFTGLANLYRDQGKYAEAEPLYQQALSIWEQQLGLEHYLVAYALSGLANLYRDQGKYAEAEPLYQQALSIREQQLGLEHPDIAYLLSDLAVLSFEQGKYTEAEPLYQRALHIWEQRLGPEHLQVTVPLNGLANLYAKQNNYIGAEPLYQRVLHIREQQLGPEHPHIATPLTCLAILYKQQGKYAEAEPLYQRALHIRKQQLGPEHPQVAVLLINLANLSFEQGKYTEAEPLYQRALPIWEQQLGLEHPHVAHALTGLANLYRVQENYTEAALLYQRALHVQEHILEPHHPDIADTLYGFAALHETQGNAPEAVSLYRRAFLIREQAFGPNHPKTVDAHKSLHAILITLGRPGQAEQIDVVQSEDGEPMNREVS